MSNEQSNGIDQATNAITKAVNECSLEKVSGMPVMQQAIVLAKGMALMRSALTQSIVNELLMPLQGIALGFRTDKDSGQGYGWEVVRDCAIEAMMRGFNVVGNEFNIISNRAYFTKEGLSRRVMEFPGLTELVLEPGVPQNMGDKGALVPYRATWKLNGKFMEVKRWLVQHEDKSTTDNRIPVRVNAGMGADAILGKAKRKIMAQIFDQLTGSRISTADGDVLDVEGVPVPEEAASGQKPATESKVDDLVEKHRAKAADKKNGAKAAAGDAKADGKTEDPAADSSGLPAPGADG